MQHLHLGSWLLLNSLQLPSSVISLMYLKFITCSACQGPHCCSASITVILQLHAPSNNSRPRLKVPVLWLNRLSHYLQCWYSIWMPVWVLAMLLPIQNHASVPGKAAENGPNCWTSGIHVENLDGRSGSWLQPGPSLGYCSPLESIPADVRSVSPVSAFQKVLKSLFIYHLKCPS